MKNRKKWDPASLLALLAAAAVFFGLYAYAHWDDPAPGDKGENYAEYEKAVVTQILADNCEPDPVADGGYRGEQTLLAEVKTGQYKGQTLMTTNSVGPLFGEPAAVGDRVVLIISTYAGGDHRATVYEYDRSLPIYLIVGIFFLVTVLVGGKTGAKSILGLVLTVGLLLTVLIPLLLKGWPMVPTVFGMCAFVAILCFVILGGANAKTLCASLGTVAGMALALCFGLLAQRLAHISGLRMTDAEPLLQLRQTGTPIGLKGLLVAGIIVSSLGAVMDVAMSISSALWELKTVNPELKGRDLWKSGMNIGRDMVGTMTNTLILAFLGSGFTLVVYLYSLDLPMHELMSSSYMGLEAVSGISAAIGVVLSVPLTCLAGALLYGRRR